MTEYLMRTWADIYLDRLSFNLHQIQATLPASTKVMGVVKADGYGHGDALIASSLQAEGIDFFAVSNLDEALSLRSSGIHGEILILGFTPPSQARVLSEKRITQTVFSKEYAHQLNDACLAEGVRLSAHIKLDSGMGRIGFIQDESRSAAEEIAAICRLPAIHVTGIFTHFSSADQLDEASVAYTQRQIHLFFNAVEQLERLGIRFEHKHIQNSAGIAFRSNLHGMDYARAGIILYGAPPSGEALPFALQPVMELKTVISMVKEIPAGCSISYGRTFVSTHPMRIATVPIGYADGYPRLLSNRGFMLIHGKRAPILGNICMDQLMLDITSIEDVHMGDIVTVVGQDGADRIGFDELAALCGTINYELMCLIGRRVPRVYHKDGEIVEVVDYLQQSRCENRG